MSDATTEKSLTPDEIAEVYATKAADATRKVVTKTLSLVDTARSAVTTRRAAAVGAFGAAKGTMTAWYAKAKARVSAHNGAATPVP